VNPPNKTRYEAYCRTQTVAHQCTHECFDMYHITKAASATTKTKQGDNRCRRRSSSCHLAGITLLKPYLPFFVCCCVLHHLIRPPFCVKFPERLHVISSLPLLTTSSCSGAMTQSGGLAKVVQEQPPCKHCCKLTQPLVPHDTQAYACTKEPLLLWTNPSLYTQHCMPYGSCLSPAVLHLMLSPTPLLQRRGFV
jgi:hypothetical protein